MNLIFAWAHHSIHSFVLIWIYPIYLNDAALKQCSKELSHLVCLVILQSMYGKYNCVADGNEVLNILKGS